MNKDIEFLKELQQELKTQDIDCQASPRFWTIADYQYERCEAGFHDEVFLSSMEGEFFGGLEEIKDDIKNNYSDDEKLCEKIKELECINCEEGATEWIRENLGYDAEVIPVELKHKVIPDTMFLTKAEAKEHIRLNHYHYSSKVHTYAMTAWRAPKVSRLLKILENLDWDSVLNLNKE